MLYTQDERKRRRKANLPEQNLVSQTGIPEGLLLMTVLPLSSSSHIPLSLSPADEMCSYAVSDITLESTEEKCSLHILTLSTTSAPPYSEMDDLSTVFSVFSTYDHWNCQCVIFY